MTVSENFSESFAVTGSGAGHSGVSFAELGLSEERVELLTGLGFAQPTEIQVRSIPHLLAGKDVLGLAQTGTGKTAAFALPLLERLDAQKACIQALILAPTRELALQVAQSIRQFAGKKGVRVATVYGGQSIDRQIAQIERGAQILVGTPGRTIDLLERGVLSLDTLTWFVLDEADEMLNMGFVQDIERIMEALPATRQTALFSATMPGAIARLVKKYLKAPVTVEISTAGSAPKRIQQQAYLVPQHITKEEALLLLLELESPTAAIVFVRTKDNASRVAAMLQQVGYSVDEYHGNLTQIQREALIRRFRNQQVKLLVATDIAARGLDVDSVTHVFNLDLPDDLERYVHRIGRTGRAGREGTAITFITARERYKLRHLEQHTKQALETLPLPKLAQIQARRISRFEEQLQAALSGERLASFLPLVARLSEDYDPQAIAAAAMQLAFYANRSEAAEQTVMDILSRQAEARPPVRRDGEDRRPPRPRIAGERREPGTDGRSDGHGRRPVSSSRHDR
ncbi:MAG: DEAD/DEAH box helicase [Pseudanabaenaceae cyanobacterium]